MLTRDEALNVVRQYKQLIAPRFDGLAKVYMYGSYSKGYPNPWSDIDVAVIVPSLRDKDWYETSVSLCRDGERINSLIEPVLMAEDHWSPLYEDVMLTGVPI